jgi:acetoin utilization deacetylase AcuC-like enzyme
MEMSDGGFRALVRRALGVLPPGVGVGLMLEGGYDLLGLGQSLSAVLEGLSEGPQQEIPASRLWASHERDLKTAAAAATELWQLG